MKVGIITFHQALNYGALLQAYALRKVICLMGGEAEIIDYHCSIIEDAYVFPTLRNCKSVKEILKYVAQGKYEIEKRKRFDAFRKQKLEISDASYNTNNIDKAVYQYERFVTGSDQVWNCNAHNFDKNYFLNFVKDSTRKFSYAASLGLSKIPEQLTSEYYEQLKEFNICSVREMQGKIALEHIGIRNVRVDIDPSLLLSKEEWTREFNIIPKKEYFIFAYYFELTPSLKKFIEELASKTGCYVKYFGSPIRSPFRCKCRAVKTADPIDFVDAVFNAEYVVTNSFHGTAFSINFNKTFFVELLNKSADVNSRLVNILDVTDLSNREIHNFKNVSEALSAHVDWHTVNKKLNLMRQDSLEYVRSIVK